MAGGLGACPAFVGPAAQGCAERINPESLTSMHQHQPIAVSCVYSFAIFMSWSIVTVWRQDASPDMNHMIAEWTRRCLSDRCLRSWRPRRINLITRREADSNLKPTRHPRSESPPGLQPEATAPLILGLRHFHGRISIQFPPQYGSLVPICFAFAAQVDPSPALSKSLSQLRCTILHSRVQSSKLLDTTKPSRPKPITDFALKHNLGNLQSRRHSPPPPAVQ